MHAVPSEVLTVEAVLATGFAGVACNKLIRFARESKAISEFVLAVSLLTDTCALLIAPDVVLVGAAWVHFVFLATAVLETETFSTFAFVFIFCHCVFGALSTLTRTIKTIVAESATALAFAVGVVEMGFSTVSGFARPTNFFSSIRADAFIVFVHERRFACVAETISVVASRTPSRAGCAATICHHKLSGGARALRCVTGLAASIFSGCIARIALFASPRVIRALLTAISTLVAHAVFFELAIRATYLFIFPKAGVAGAISAGGAMAPAIFHLKAVPAGFAGEPIVTVSAAPAALRAVVVQHVEVIASRAVATRAIGVLNAHALAAAVKNAHLGVRALGAVLGGLALEAAAAAGHAHFVVEVPKLAFRTVLLHKLGLLVLLDLCENGSDSVGLGQLHVCSVFAHLDQLLQLCVTSGWTLHQSSSRLGGHVQVAERIHLFKRHRRELIVLEDGFALIVFVELVDLVISLQEHVLCVVECRTRNKALVLFCHMVQELLLVRSGSFRSSRMLSSSGNWLVAHLD